MHLMKNKVVLKHYYLILFLLKIMYFHYFMQKLVLVTKLFIHTLIGLIKKIEPITDEEVELTNDLIDLKIDLTII